MGLSCPICGGALDTYVWNPESACCTSCANDYPVSRSGGPRNLGRTLAALVRFAVIGALLILAALWFTIGHIAFKRRGEEPRISRRLLGMSFTQTHRWPQVRTICVSRAVAA